jgi:hypothetical protein
MNIKQIPLIKEVVDDQIMWMYASDGNYTVKTGYKAISQWNDSRQDGLSNRDIFSKVLNKVWSLNTIPRHIALLWRILNDVVPVRSALSKRGIQCSIICPSCSRSEETISHAFVNCPSVSKVWFGTSLNIKFPQQDLINFKEWLIYVIQSTKEEEIIIQIAAIIYNIWQARNSLVFDNHKVTEEDIINRAYRNIQDYQSANNNKDQPINKSHARNNNDRRSSNHIITQKWNRPIPNIIKANSDANLSDEGRWGLSRRLLFHAGGV